MITLHILYNIARKFIAFLCKKYLFLCLKNTTSEVAYNYSASEIIDTFLRNTALMRNFALGNCFLETLLQKLLMSRKKKTLPLLERVEITGVAAEGKAMARIRLNADDERTLALFVPYGAPGDVADIQIDRRKNSFAEGHIVKLVKPSSERCSPRCSHFGLCGGCRWQHLPYDAQLRHKQQQVVDALTRIGHLELPAITPISGSEEIFGYRNKMEYTFSAKKWRTWEEMRSGEQFTDFPSALGFHIPGGFDKVLHIDHCYLQGEPGNEIRNRIFEYAEANNLDFYDIRNNCGLLRTLMIRTASTGQLMVVVVFGRQDDAIFPLLQFLSEEFPKIDSLLYVINEKLNDSIADQEVNVFRGLPYIEEEMDGLRFRINAKSFYQTNSRQAYVLYSIVRELALKGRNSDIKPVIYDLYTGTGTIANFVGRAARKVVGIEYVEEAVKDARINSQVNGLDNTVFYAGDMKRVLTDRFIYEHGHPEVLITDPPRAGMDGAVVETIKRTRPEVIVYVSCNPATQARDLQLLSDMYTITDVHPVDMFPHTHHVENVVRLELIS